MLTLAGLQTIDLGRKDTLKVAGSKVHAGTADILAYAAARRALLIGACTVGVPKDEDYEKLLHATTILKREFPAGSTTVLVPVLFCGQQGESVLRDALLERGVHLYTHADLVRLRAMIESGKPDIELDSILPSVERWFVSARITR